MGEDIFKQLDAIFYPERLKKQKSSLSLTKKEKRYIIHCMCGSKLANDFDMIGMNLLVDRKQKKIIEAFKKLCTYNKVIPDGNKFSDYCKALASIPDRDYRIPAEFVK